MEQVEGGRSVVVAVQPRLLADVLAQALRGNGAVIDVEVSDSAWGSRRHFNVAVVTGALRPGLSADTVIQLPAAGDDQGGLVTSADRTEPARIPDLAALVETVTRYICLL